MKEIELPIGEGLNINTFVETLSNQTKESIIFSYKDGKMQISSGHDKVVHRVTVDLTQRKTVGELLAAIAKLQLPSDAKVVNIAEVAKQLIITIVGLQ